MLLLLTAIPAVLGLSFVFDFWGDDDEETDQSTTVEGDETSNILIGDSGSDIISGYDGDDTLNGNEGDDTLYGGDGDDNLNGNGNDDLLFGGDGDDEAEGGYGDDRVFLDDGNDTYGLAGVEEFAQNLGLDLDLEAEDLDLDLESTEDSAIDLGEIESVSELFDLAAEAVYRQEGDDFIRGGAGNDIIFDALGSNTVYGDEGADQIATVDFDDIGATDTVFGGYGADTILVDDGDTVSGGANADEIIVLRFEAEDDDVVTVTDFTPEEDSLDLIWTGTALSGTPEIGYNDENDGVMLSYNGVDLAFLADMTGDQLASANITLTTFET